MTGVVAGLYWRQSLLRGTRCVPVLLGAADGRLRLRTASGPVLDVPGREVEARFTVWGTLRLTVGGDGYALIGAPATTSPRFSEAQLVELRTAWAAGAQLPDATNGSGSREPAQPLPGGDALTVVARMRGATRAWRTVLPELGAQVR